VFVNEVCVCIVDWVFVFFGGVGYVNGSLFVCVYCDVKVVMFMYLFGVNCVYDYFVYVVFGEFVVLC